MIITESHPTTAFALPTTNTITIHIADEEVMRLDAKGMTYKGQRIEDGGEAHCAFLEVMGRIREAT